MEKWQLDHIEKNPQLLELLKVSPKLVNRLKKHKILNDEEFEIIFSKVTSYEKADELLRCLKIRDSYYKLVAELKADGTLNEAVKILMDHPKYKQPDNPQPEPTDLPQNIPHDGTQSNQPDGSQVTITNAAHYNASGGVHYYPTGDAQFNPTGDIQCNPTGGVQFNPAGGVQYTLRSGPQDNYPGGSQNNYPGAPQYNNPGNLQNYHAGGPQYAPSGIIQYYPHSGPQYVPSGCIQYYPHSGPPNYPVGSTQYSPVVLQDNIPGVSQDSAISGLIVGDPGCDINTIVVSLYGHVSEHKLADDWQKLAKALEVQKSFTSNLQRKIRIDGKGGTEILDDLLHEWRSRKSKEATFTKLLVALKSSGMEDIADTLRVKFTTRK